MTLLETIMAFFAEEGWPLQRGEEEDALHFTFHGERGEWYCTAQTQERDKIIMFYTAAPFTIPDSKLPTLAEFVCRANCQIEVGHLQLDFDLGELSCKTSICAENIDLSFALIRNLFYANLGVMEELTPAFMAVLREDISPEEALNLLD
ncbi:YbjN domain-containing protein [Roseofilum casamattae]|uniref:YbjN domain-containing protein n=1 Tax=Roseofilum casamattae BLCC-M143 TaxID=3022442 RepID=A0ABT7BWP2_9CYAN|nr:YbjN domain-containing protein [Roseofilum casamattae]MDJ1183603.1 YbjN domain-containing protein [Roseofilum casamattae BLCC-M143]